MIIKQIKNNSRVPHEASEQTAQFFLFVCENFAETWQTHREMHARALHGSKLRLNKWSGHCAPDSGGGGGGNVVMHHSSSNRNRLQCKPSHVPAASLPRRVRIAQWPGSSDALQLYRYRCATTLDPRGEGWPRMQAGPLLISYVEW